MTARRWVAVGGVVGALGVTAAALATAPDAVGVGPASRTLAVPAGFPVDRFLAHWWVFPASVAFSLVALAGGVFGAPFFSPFFMLVVGVSPSHAIGAGLLRGVFGMGNGLLNSVRQRVVDYATATWLLVGAVPAVVVGATAGATVHAPPQRPSGTSSRGRSPASSSAGPSARASGSTSRAR